MGWFLRGGQQAARYQLWGFGSAVSFTSRTSSISRSSSVTEGGLSSTENKQDVVWGTGIENCLVAILSLISTAGGHDQCTSARVHCAYDGYWANVVMHVNSCWVTCCFARMNSIKQCRSFRSYCRRNQVINAHYYVIMCVVCAHKA